VVVVFEEGQRCEGEENAPGMPEEVVRGVSLPAAKGEVEQMGRKEGKRMLRIVAISSRCVRLWYFSASLSGLHPNA
jgi:hypothetical protein